MTLTVSNLSLSFDKPVLDNISFVLPQGQIACLLGKSGCGKTSILRCLLGFETPQTGQITLNDTPLFEKDKHNVAPHLRGIGMVFQDYALFSHLTVAGNIGFGLKHLPKAQQQARIDELLALTQLTGLANRYPHELSGGQQQRVALARAIAPKPSVILLDEPFSNLDTTLRQELSLQIKELLKQTGVSAILVTHDQSEAFAFADQIGIVIDGKLAQWASAYDLYAYPANQAVATFIGTGSLLPIYACEHGQVLTAMGGIPSANASLANTDFSVDFANANLNYAHQTARLFVRPEHIHISKHPMHNWATATVSTKVFVGAAWQYTLLLADNSPIIAQSAQNYDIGDELYLQATQGWVVR